MVVEKGSDEGLRRVQMGPEVGVKEGIEKGFDEGFGEGITEGVEYEHEGCDKGFKRNEVR